MSLYTKEFIFDKPVSDKELLKSTSPCKKRINIFTKIKTFLRKKLSKFFVVEKKKSIKSKDLFPKNGFKPLQMTKSGYGKKTLLSLAKESLINDHFKTNNS